MRSEAAIVHEILVLKDCRQLGPYSVEEINSQLSARVFEASDLAWHEGMAEWQPLDSITGVVTGHTHGLRPPPPPVRNTGRSSSPSSNPSVPSSSSILVGGYICAAMSLLFLPPVLGLAGIVCGVVVIKRQDVNKGIPLLIVSFVCTALGMMIGAVSCNLGRLGRPFTHRSCLFYERCGGIAVAATGRSHFYHSVMQRRQK